MQLVDIKDLKIHQDDRGYLYEVIHNYDLDKFGQTYIVHDPTAGIVRAFHKHHKLVDYFCIVKGSAKFVFEKDGVIEWTVLTDRNPQVIEVPTEVFHGWMSLEDDTILLSTGSEVYDGTDEERIPSDSFDGFVGNPWQITRK